MSLCKAHQVCDCFIPMMRNSKFQQLAIDKKLNSNGRENRFIHYSVKTIGLMLNLKKQKHSTACLSPTLHRQGYKEVKLHVILIGVMGTIYKDYRQTSGRPHEN